VTASRALTALVLPLVLFAVAGCGGSDRERQPAAPKEAAEAAAFPVTIEHKYGRTEIARVPERVVTVGFNEHDFVLALGVTPVAVRDWFGEQPYATWPWARDELAGAKPEVLPSGELNFEQIAALRPDLILGIYSGMTKKEYATLSEIAPTVPQSREYVDFGVPWEEQTRLIGRALGREERADELVTDVERSVAQAREEHPEFEGASGVVAYSFSPREYGVYGPQDPRTRFLTSLGFELPDRIGDLTGKSFYATISRERLELVEADLLVWIVSVKGTREAVEADPVYRQLDVAREGRDVFPSEPLAGALSFSTPLSLPYALERLVPMLAAAVDGDPATTAPSR